MKTKILSSLVDSMKKYDLFKSLELRFIFSNNTKKINDNENIVEEIETEDATEVEEIKEEATAEENKTENVEDSENDSIV